MGTIHFGHTGGWQTFNVPNGVTLLEFVVNGGGSGATQGGQVAGKYRVKDTDVLHVLVGQAGHGGSGHNGGASSTGGGAPGGDAGSGGQPGGAGGGGASQIRLNSQTGPIVAVAGGAGGAAGDTSPGGAGGTNRGNNGQRGDGSTANVASGGTQAQGGNGGTIPSNHNFDGDDAANAVLAAGGRGGQAADDRANGGGGGGGGYHPGGGGQAGRSGVFWGGGGAGGSSFVDNLFDVSINTHLGGTGNGGIDISWDVVTTTLVTPTDVKINGVDEADELPTAAVNITISAVVDETVVGGGLFDTGHDLRAFIICSPYGDPGQPDGQGGIYPYFEMHGDYVSITGGRSSATINGLTPNTLYRARIYTQHTGGAISNGHNSVSFWTDRSPDQPVNTVPDNDSEFDTTDTIAFAWTTSDPDGGDQIGWAFRFRTAPTVTEQAGPWFAAAAVGNVHATTWPASIFPAGAIYEWQVASEDPLGLWSVWSESSTFLINAVAIPPLLQNPIHDASIYSDEANVFKWAFLTGIAGETQTTVDIRYRVVGGGDSDWLILTGDPVTPGHDPRWLIDAETFAEDTHYEWQARVHTSSLTVSEWSVSGFFYSLRQPGQIIDPIPVDFLRAQEALGQYDNRVYVYARGGKIPLGEITPLVDVDWSRVRDDIGSCLIHVNEWNDEAKEFYRRLKPWAHELVVFRNGVRCFEGPITRITGSKAMLEIEAKDVMAYVYRRILRQGYNDSYQIVAGQQIGLKSVVYRAQKIITNALVYDDPNVLPYLTPIKFFDDAVQSRIVKAYTKTAWEEVDDLAAHAGLDYSISGRRIILNDTHRPVGRLFELTEGDFSDPPIVTVYGMTFATDFAVTNGDGVWGLAQRRDETLSETGWIEQLASQYGESDVAGTGTSSLTPAELAALQATLTAQAQRNIAGRYPMPVVVRVPDNSSLSPDVNLGINQLIPGVWAPLRATEGIVQASQWQKLDSMSVHQDGSGEKVSVVFSPAPNGGADPDADLEAEVE